MWLPVRGRVRKANGMLGFALALVFTVYLWWYCLFLDFEIAGIFGTASIILAVVLKAIYERLRKIYEKIQG